MPRPSSDFEAVLDPETEKTASGGWSRWIRSLALVLSFLCLAWVAWPILKQIQDLKTSVAGVALLKWVLLGCFLYAVISVLLGIAWWWLAGVYGRSLSPRQGYAIWARSQWAKYLPGNAFHYVSRQVLGRRAGLSHAALVASGLLELGSLLIAALLISLAGAGASAEAESWTKKLAPWVVVAILIALASWPALDRLLRRWSKTAAHMRELPQLALRQIGTLLGPAVLLYALFFVATGFLLLLLLRMGWGTLPISEGRVISLFALAWLAGTVTIGAPAGVGVREAILSLGLASVLEPAQASILALALRVVTTGGDCLSALCGWFLAPAEGETLSND